MSAAQCDTRSREALSIAERLGSRTHSLLRSLKADETLLSEIQILLEQPE
jgi:hypothetical protein